MILFKRMPEPTERFRGSGVLLLNYMIWQRKKLKGAAGFDHMEVDIGQRGLKLSGDQKQGIYALLYSMNFR